MATYPPLVGTLVNGEDVDAGITNRPLNQLVERTDFLKERLDGLADALSVVTSFDLPVSDGVLDSQLVYYNAGTSKYEPGIAELAAAGSPPTFTPTDRNNIVGIATNIRGTPGSKIADVLHSGRITAARVASLTLLETTAVLEPGKTLFLSATAGQEGRCSSSVPGLRIAVGWFETDGALVLDIDARSLGEDHLHYRFDLIPAKWTDLGGAVPLTGTPTFTGSSQVVSGAGTLFSAEVSPGDAIKLDADGLYYQVDSVASDTSLILTAPYAGPGGASAGSVATGPWLYPGTELSPFPPIPFESTVLVVNGQVFTYGDEYTVDTDGVHLEIADGPPTEDGLYEAQLFYSFPLGASSPGVTSLRPGTGNVRIVNCSPGGPPETGDLKISVIDEVNLVSESLLSGLAVKSLGVNPTSGALELFKGPVVEQLLGGGGIKVSSGGTGLVTISTTGASQELRGLSDIVLRNAKESIQGLTSYIEFKKGLTSKFFSKIRLDDDLDLTKPLEIVFELLGEATFVGSSSDVQFQMEYHVIDVSGNESLNKAKKIVSSTIQLPSPYTAFSTFSATVFTIAGSELSAGGTLSMLIRRLEAADSYPDSIGIVHPLYRSSSV